VRSGGCRVLNEGPSQQSEPPSDDELVAGKYELIRLIGRGGMGSVWEGRHVTLGTRVACKFIDADFASKSPEARTRFKNEARAAASLRSKHVVDVHDYGVMKDGRPYIVMEFLPGESLADRLERVGRLPLTATARIVSQVGRALWKAHAAGIVHRDLKPDNIFLMWDEEDEQDQVKVVDFGIAKFTDERVGVSHATQTGSVVGTPYFMSPEQARGIEVIDLRSDLWALGVVTFQCLTGQLPFHSEAVGDLLIKICTGDIPVPSHVSPDLPLSMDAWMARALERDRDLRFQSAREMTDALADAIGPIARTLLESQADEERRSIRPRRHLTAGPRAGQVLTGSSHPPSVLRLGGNAARKDTVQYLPVLRRYAPALAVLFLVVAASCVWFFGRAPGPAQLADGAVSTTLDPGSKQAPSLPKPATETPSSGDVEGTPLSELAVEPSRPSPTGGNGAKGEPSGRRPSSHRSGGPSSRPAGEATPNVAPAQTPNTSADGVAAPPQDPDIGLGY
jgi:serine/threonine protein kinase